MTIVLVEGKTVLFSDKTYEKSFLNPELIL